MNQITGKQKTQTNYISHQLSLAVLTLEWMVAVSHTLPDSLPRDSPHWMSETSPQPL